MYAVDGLCFPTVQCTNEGSQVSFIYTAQNHKSHRTTEQHSKNITVIKPG